MRHLAIPPIYQAADHDNLTELLTSVAAEQPHRTLALYRTASGGWRELSTQQVLSEVIALARGLIAAGVRPGDRIGLMSHTRYEWLLCDFAIWFAGAVTVPIYETSSTDQARWILSDSGAKACFVESAAHAVMVDDLHVSVPNLQQVWQLDTPGFTALVEAGREIPETEIGYRRAALHADDIATIIYTSGTTGRPKGCELTHRNLLTETWTAVKHVHEVFAPPDCTTIMFLPLAHVLARVVQLMAVAGKARIAYSSSVKDLTHDLAEVRPTFLLGVPRVFEKMYNTAERKAGGGLKGRLFRRASATALAYSKALDAPGSQGELPRVLRWRHRLYERLVYEKMQHALGGRLEIAVSGGAPLSEQLGHFFRGSGLHIIEGYGLTETTAAVHVNTPRETRIGTVGRPLPGMSVRIADDGEVLLKGPMVFRGYHHNSHATTEAFDADGWLHTGDRGKLDNQGYLTITGRAKELIVTAGGKNVSPSQLEDVIRAHPLIGQCLVVGDGRPYIGCLVTLDTETLPHWLEKNGRDRNTALTDLVEDPMVREAVQHVIDHANHAVSTAESIRRFVILPTEFTEHGGQLTPSLKVKREVVVEEFAHAIDAMYAQPR